MIVFVGLVSCLIIFYRYFEISIIVLNRRLINLYNITRFCGSLFFFVLRKIVVHLKFPCLYLFSVNSLILISLSVFYAVNLSSFSNLNSYVELMLVLSYLQSCYLFEITWLRVCVKLTNLYLPESIHLFQVFFLWINFSF